MTLASVLGRQSTLHHHVRPGVTAVRAADRRLIAPAACATVGDSLDLDEAMRPGMPNGHRWDYLLSVPKEGRLVAVEPHTANNHEIDVVIRKKRNAMAYLRGHFAPGTPRVREWYWVTRGAVQFTPMERARRLLDQEGIQFVGRRLRHL